jgi:hypothetical protein
MKRSQRDSSQHWFAAGILDGRKIRNGNKWRNDVARCRYGPEFQDSLLEFCNIQICRRAPIVGIGPAGPP